MNPLAVPARALLALLASLALLCGCGTSDSAGSAARAGDQSGTRAHQAQSFVQSIGVNTHTYYSDTVYRRRFGMVERRLRQLGVRHIRENLVPHRPDQYRQLRRLGAAGIRSQLILGDPGNGRAVLRHLVGILATRVGGAADAAEGPNEYDLSDDPRWRPPLARYQAALYDEVRATPALSSVPVVGPSLGRLGDELSAPDLAADLDYGNVHPYPNGEPPEDGIDDWLRGAATMSGSKPVMATETGYHTALRSSSGQRPVSEAAMATYVPRLYLANFARGVVRTFPYELVDEFPDPRRAEPEWNFGLLRNNLSPKPAFGAVRHLIDVLADPGPSFAPGRLDYSLAGDTDDLGQLLLQKRDGRFFLALWRTSRVWDPDRRVALTPVVAPVRVGLATAPDRVRLFLPNRSDRARGELAVSAGATSLQVGPRVAILEIDAGG